jgi:hypothetical protein
MVVAQDAFPKLGDAVYDFFAWFGLNFLLVSQETFGGRMESRSRLLIDSTTVLNQAIHLWRAKWAIHDVDENRSLEGAKTQGACLRHERIQA